MQVKQKTAAEVARQEQEDDEEDEAQHNYSESETFKYVTTYNCTGTCSVSPLFGRSCYGSWPRKD